MQPPPERRHGPRYGFSFQVLDVYISLAMTTPRRQVGSAAPYELRGRIQSGYVQHETPKLGPGVIAQYHRLVVTGAVTCPLNAWK